MNYEDFASLNVRKALKEKGPIACPFPHSFPSPEPSNEKVRKLLWLRDAKEKGTIPTEQWTSLKRDILSGKDVNLEPLPSSSSVMNPLKVEILKEIAVLRKAERITPPQSSYLKSHFLKEDMSLVQGDVSIIAKRLLDEKLANLPNEENTKGNNHLE
jgi:hypothetical protein